MSTPETVFVTIKSVGRIPFINRSGPVTTPISIPSSIAASLKALGFAVTVHKPAEVAVDSVTRARRLVSVEEFVAATPSDDVDVDSAPQPVVVTIAAANYTPATEATDTVNAPNAPAADEGADANDNSESNSADASNANDEGNDEGDASEETDELTVFPLETYKSWTKKKRHEYLVTASPLLPADVVEKLDNMSTADLLATIEKYIVNAA